MPEWEGHSGGVELAAGPETGEGELGFSLDIEGFEEGTEGETEAENAEDLLSGGMMIRNVNGTWLDESGREFMPEDGHDGLQHDLDLKAQLLSMQVGQSKTNEAQGQTLEGDDVMYTSTYTMTAEGLQFSWGQREISEPEPEREQASDSGMAGLELASSAPNSSLEAMIADVSSVELPQTTTASPEAAPAKPAETILSAPKPTKISEPKPGESQAKPEPKPERDNQFWKSLSETEVAPKPASDGGLLDHLRNEPEPSPKPEKVFVVPAAPEKAQAKAETPVPEAKKAESRTDQTPAIKAEQTAAKPEQSAEPKPDDSPEPTGGRSAEQPAEIHSDTDPAPEVVVHADAPEVVASADTATEVATVDALAEAPVKITATETAPDISADAQLEAPPVITETVAEIATEAPLEAPVTAITAETMVEAAPVVLESIETPPAQDVTESVEFTQEAPPVVIESMMEPAEIAEEVIPVIAEAQLVEAPPQEAEIAPDVREVLEQPAVQAESITAAPAEMVAEEVVEVVEIPQVSELVVEFSSLQEPQTETVAPAVSQAEHAVVQERPAQAIENDLPEEFSFEPAEAAPAQIVATSAPSTATAAHADITVQAGDEGLDITMALDEPAEAPRRQKRTRPAHLTVGSQPTEQTWTKPFSEIPSTPIEAPTAPVIEIPMAPVSEQPSTPAVEIQQIATTIRPSVPDRAVAFETLVTSSTSPAEKPVAPVTYPEIENSSESQVENIPVQDISEQGAAVVPEFRDVSAADISVPEIKNAPAEAEVAEPAPFETPMEPVVQITETNLQPVQAKLQTVIPELQSWSEDFGAGSFEPASETIVAQMDKRAPIKSLENLTQPSFVGMTFANDQYPPAQDNDDDDPGVVISFEQSERRRTARRSHNSRSTAA